MTVRWGRVEVEELTKEPGPGGHLRHHPTGISLANDLNIDTRESAAKSLYGPALSGQGALIHCWEPPQDLRMRLAARAGLNSTQYILAHGHVVAGQMEQELKREEGLYLICSKVEPKPGFEPFIWTAARRDAVAMMLFAYREVVYEDAPYPSTLNFRPVGVSDEFHGLIHNPVLEDYL